MERNDTFSLVRFGLVLRKFLVENRTQHLLGAALLLVVMLTCGAFLGFQASEDIAEDQMELASEWIRLVSAAVACIAASMMFGSYNSRGCATALTLPASALEVFLSRWVVAVPILFLLCLLCAMAGEAVRVSVGAMVGEETMLRVPFADIVRGDNTSRSFIGSLSPLKIMALQSFFLLGSIVWRGRAFAKTVGALFGLGLLLYLVSAGVSVAFLYVRARLPFSFFFSPLSYVPGWVVYAVMLFNYILAFMRLREAETIQRW